jgi:N-acetylglucosamine kinase-like BadF-type ATPase
MRTFIGIDGGGTKTAFVLIDASGRVLAEHTGGPAYHPEVGLSGLRELIRGGCESLARGAGIALGAVDFAFIGIPAYGEDSALKPQLDAIAADVLAQERYRCGNDMVCAWAGALAGADGINIVAGTGSIAYGEFRGRSARAGGWGELFSDEGSAFWLAREGLALFSKMSDGRAVRGALYTLIREHFALVDDLDLCAAIYGKPLAQRSELARLAELVSRAATGGDSAAREIFARGVSELVLMLEAVLGRLEVGASEPVAVSYAGSLFKLEELCLTPLRQRLDAQRFKLRPPRLSPAAGAALYAARVCGTPLGEQALHTLERHAPR